MGPGEDLADLVDDPPLTGLAVNEWLGEVGEGIGHLGRGISHPPLRLRHFGRRYPGQQRVVGRVVHRQVRAAVVRGGRGRTAPPPTGSRPAWRRLGQPGSTAGSARSTPSTASPYGSDIAYPPLGLSCAGSLVLQRQLGDRRGA